MNSSFLKAARFQLFVSYLNFVVFLLNYIAGNIFVSFLWVTITVISTMTTCVHYRSLLIDYSLSIYKWLLSPLVRDYKAREENYQEIIKGYQKQLSEDYKEEFIERW